MRKLLILVALAGCTVESGKDVPPVVGEGAVAVDPATQKVTLDATKVPIVPVCAAGQVVRRTADGWECAAYEIPWESVTGKPALAPAAHTHDAMQAEILALQLRASADESDVVDLAVALSSQLLLLNARLDAATEAMAAQVAAQTAALAVRATNLEATTDALRAQAMALSARAANLEAASEELRQRVAVLEAVDCPRGYIRDTSVTAFTLCTKVLSTLDGSTDEMVRVADFWIDRYEVSACGNSDLGGGDFTGNSTTAIACSKKGVQPLGQLNWFKATRMCANGGKRLCTNMEWQLAVSGTTDPGRWPTTSGDCTGTNFSAGLCNTCSGGPRSTGGGTLCRSRFGAEDMIGNFNEWVAEWHSGANAAWISNADPLQGYPADPWPTVDFGHDWTISVNGRPYNGNGYTNGMPAGALRGGNYLMGINAGAHTFSLNAGVTFVGVDTASRCCVERP